MVSLIEVLYGFGVVLFACELGQRVTNIFPEICDIIERFDWYYYPRETQELLLTIIIIA